MSMVGRFGSRWWNRWGVVAGAGLALGGVGCGGTTSPPPGAPSAVDDGASDNAGAGAGSPGEEARTTGAEPAPQGGGGSTGGSSPSPSGEPGEPNRPVGIEYPLDGIDLIADACERPFAVVTTAPKKVGWDYEWTWTRQALYANPQFHIVEWPRKPERPMDVRMDVYAMGDDFALVGVCADGTTCNKLAAMYKRTVPTCTPKLYCGAPPVQGEPRRSHIIPTDGDWLPRDTIGKCARIGTCTFMERRFVTGDPGLECQNRPQSFKVDCALQPTCGEVLSCLSR
jgi:hypothetical protein